MPRRLSWLTIPLLLTACAIPLPEPDPKMAWVDLQAGEVSSRLMAERLDGKRLDDGRYFQVTPGAHLLETTFSYFYRGGSITLKAQEPTNCIVRLHYADFAAGQRYRLMVRTLAQEVQGWLYDSNGQELAEIEEPSCWLY